MPMLAAPPRLPVITATVRKQLLLSLLADLSEATVESLNAGEALELLRPLDPPFLEPRLAAALPSLSPPALRGLLYRVRRRCRRHFDTRPEEN